MLGRLRTIANRIPWLRDQLKSREIPRGGTVLIHIGKCGGGTLSAGVENATQNRIDYTFHVERPIYRADLRYIVVARGPIARLQSAFRWRRKIVVEDEEQLDRFQGEREVLLKYQTLNQIAEAIYNEDGSPNPQAQAEIRLIHHIREDIAFYLGELLPKCAEQQVVAVLMQESLDDDIQRVFGYENELRVHENRVASRNDELSERAMDNLRRFFDADFQALTKLNRWGLIPDDVFARAMAIS